VSTFATYASYYDLLYRDKDYAAEAAFVRAVIQRFGPQVDRVLELGSGTGAHARHLAALGFSVGGVAGKKYMVECALSNQAALAVDSRDQLTFMQGDIRNLRLGEKFNCVLSLFHVMSYMAGNADLQLAFQTVRHHLSPGGICIFDCWYGPAVLHLRPSVRVKELEDIFSSIGEALVVTAADGTILSANASCYGLCGHDERWLVGGTLIIRPNTP